MMRVIFTICAILAVFNCKCAFAQGSSKSLSSGIGINGSYHHHYQTWVQGEKDNASFHFQGGGWLVYATHFIQSGAAKGQGIFTLGIAFPTFAVWGDQVMNTYTEKSSTGDTVREKLNTQGIGLGYIGRDANTGICAAMILGVERAYIDKNGDLPRSQVYPIGASGRVGLGYSPFKGGFALDLRVDYLFKHYFSAKSNGDTLKVMQSQAFVPTFGLSGNW